MKPNKPTILVVDDELSIRESFNLVLGEKYNVSLAASGEAALKKIVDQKIDLVYLDLRMPGMDGIETLRRIKQLDRDVVVTMVTAVNDIQTAGEAIRLGADDYVVKPFDVDEVLERTSDTLAKRGLFMEARSIQSNSMMPEKIELIGASNMVAEITDVIRRIAARSSNVLLAGEPGTEKETIARKIHLESGRRRERFASIIIYPESDELMRSGLFGSGTGSSAYTLVKKKGVFELGSGGTVYLENVENLSPKLQDELLAAVKDRKIVRKDQTVPISIDARIICSTSADLGGLSKAGKFDERLLGALSEVRIDIPPLRDRASDIPILAEHIIQKYNRAHGGKIAGLSKDALETLSGYSFPGNVFELERIIERAVLVQGEGTISSSRLPLYLLARSRTFKATKEGRDLTYDSMADSLERKYIGRVMAIQKGNINKAARLLGISPRALQAKTEAGGPE